jgi:hypothetical protein
MMGAHALTILTDNAGPMMIDRSALRHPPHVLPLHQDRDLAPKQLKQNAHPPRTVEAVKFPKVFSERALSQPHWISDIELRLQLQHPIRTSRCDQRFHNARWNRMGPVPLHHQAGDPQGTIDRAPLMTFKIEDDEQVARKERPHHGGELACMPDRSFALGQEGAIPLVLELGLGTLLLVRQRVHHKPPLAAGEDWLLSSYGAFFLIRRRRAPLGRIPLHHDRMPQFPRNTVMKLAEKCTVPNAGKLPSFLATKIMML